LHLVVRPLSELLSSAGPILTICAGNVTIGDDEPTGVDLKLGTGVLDLVGYGEPSLAVERCLFWVTGQWRSSTC